jgi:hypothetical protein
MNITSEFLTFAFFDGSYANLLDFIQFSDEFDFTIAEAEKQGGMATYKANFSALEATMFSFQNWDLYARKSCTFDVSLTKSTHTRSLADTNAVYSVHIADNSAALNPCLQDATSLSVAVSEMDPSAVSAYTEKVRAFSVLSIVILVLVICFYDREIARYEELFQRRYFDPESHGQTQVSYASKFSYISNCMLFLANFSLFMFYFQLSMLGVF